MRNLDMSEICCGKWIVSLDEGVSVKKGTRSIGMAIQKIYISYYAYMFTWRFVDIWLVTSRITSI